MANVFLSFPGHIRQLCGKLQAQGLKTKKDSTKPFHQNYFFKGTSRARNCLRFHQEIQLFPSIF